MGTLVRNKKGQFVKGVSGNAKGRPEGSKNAITTQKLLVEEVFRTGAGEDIQKVLKLIVKQALTGCKVSQKLIWDGSVSKQTMEVDKSAGGRAQINVKTMNVRGSDIEGEFEEVTQVEETLQ